jgi:WD40 repeat protein
LGEHAEAQRLFDRAIEDAEKAQGQDVVLEVPNGFTGDVNAVAWSRDGRRFAAAHRREISIFDTALREKFRLRGHQGLVTALAFAPDGKTLVSGSDDNTVKLWDVASGKELRTLRGHAAPVRSVACSPDGKTLVSGSWDRTVKLWDVASGKELRTLQGHASDVASVAYSPDGKTLASAGDDASIRHYRIADGLKVLLLRGLAEKDALYAFTPTGHIDLLGPDACAARTYPVCRIGALVFPFDVCEERFLVPGLLAMVHAGDTSYLEPENAPSS